MLPEVICIGEALVDRLGPRGEDGFDEILSEDCFGGAPANVACGLAQLGTNVAFAGRLGNDVIGNQFIDLLLERGVNINALQIDSFRPTRVVLVRRDLNGERSFEGFTGADKEGYADQAFNLNELIEVWPLIAQQASWLLIGTIPLASKHSAQSFLWSIDQAIENGLRIALDINWRPTFWDKSYSPDASPSRDSRALIEPIFKKVSLIKLAKEEAIWFFESSDPYEISQSLPQKPDVVVTDGANPVKWIISNFYGQMDVPADTLVVDTTGAGDAFTAGLLHQFLLCPSPTQESVAMEIIRFAIACGALVCRGAGAIDPQPKKDVVYDFLDLL